MQKPVMFWAYRKMFPSLRFASSELGRRLRSALIQTGEERLKHLCASQKLLRLSSVLMVCPILTS